MGLDALKDFAEWNPGGDATMAFEDLRDLTGIDVEKSEGIALLKQWAQLNEVAVEIADRRVAFVSRGGERASLPREWWTAGPGRLAHYKRKILSALVGQKAHRPSVRDMK